MCIADWRVCGSTCVACPENATATTCVSGQCRATACGNGTTVCNGGAKCCGLRSELADGLGDSAQVGAGIRDGGIGVFAFDAYYSNNLRVGETTGPDGGLGPLSNVGLAPARELGMAVDSAGVTHLVYSYSEPFSSNPDLLRHAYRAPGGSWTIETVYTATSGILLETSMGAAPNGDLRVVVADNLADDLLYFEKNGSTWTAPVAVPGGLYAAREFDVTVDAQGVAHIVVPMSNGIHYAFGNATTLAVGPDVRTGVTGMPSVAVDSTGKVHAVWVEASKVKRSSLTAGVWSTPVDIASSISDGPTDIAFDGADRMHVAFAGCGSQDCGVRYGYETSTGWALQTLVKPTGFDISSVQHVALAVTPGGDPFIAASTTSDGVFVFYK